MENKCFWCDGTGKEKIPKNEEKFDVEFDRLEAMGQFSLNECREKALKFAGYEERICSHCNGTGKSTE